MVDGEIPTLIRDMVSEFIRKRENVTEYVESKYFYLNDDQKTAKAEQIWSRIELAGKVHGFANEIGAFVETLLDKQPVD